MKFNEPVTDRELPFPQGAILVSATDREGRRIGSVVEWVDRTAEIGEIEALSSEIFALLKSVERSVAH